MRRFFVRPSAVGFGESRPIADNATADGRTKNRRIAVTLAGGDTAPAADDSEDDDGSQ